MHVIACIDLHAIACKLRLMTNTLLADIEVCRARLGLGKHRFGILAAKNGRLIERLEACARRGRSPRIAPETEEEIRGFIAKVMASPPSEGRAA